MSLGLHKEKVKLVPHNPKWASLYDAEEEKLWSLLDDNVVDIQHVGSTSIPGIVAKPLMSILITVKDLSSAKLWAAQLANEDYHIREDDERHLLYAKGPDDKRSYHLHVAPAGSEYAGITVLFRDYLRTHPAVAREYEGVKKDLAKKYADNRPEYGRNKASFIMGIVEIAKSKRGKTQ